MRERTFRVRKHLTTQHFCTYVAEEKLNDCWKVLTYGGALDISSVYMSESGALRAIDGKGLTKDTLWVKTNPDNSFTYVYR
jgi:hypothetical protein